MTILLDLEFLLLSLAVGLQVEVVEEHEEDRRVEEQQGGDELRVAAVEDQRLRAVHEHQEELHLEVGTNIELVACALGGDDLLIN